MPWTVELMNDRIAKAIGNGYLTSFSLDYVGYLRLVSKSVIDEFINIISKQRIHPEDGLTEIRFSRFEKDLMDFDEGVFDSLIPISKKLNKLTVSNMSQTSKSNRTVLMNMNEKILKNDPPLTHLDFDCLFYD